LVDGGGHKALETPATETVPEIVRGHARVAPAAPALVADGQDALHYVDLVRQMDRIQARLNAFGFGRGDRIATVGGNDPAAAALVVGIWGCAAAVPMNPVLSVGEFAIYLRDLKVQAVAVDAEMETAVRGVARDMGLPIFEVERIDHRVAGMIDLRSDSPPREAARPGRSRLEDLAMVLTTSGTTSHSKVVPITQRQLANKFRRTAGAYSLTASDRCLNLMPLFHAHGLFALGNELVTSGSYATLPEFSADTFFRLLESLQPTWYTGSYTFHMAIHAAAAAHAASVERSRLRFFRTASGPLDAQIVQELEALFRAPAVNNYGSTEIACICCTPFPPAVRKPGTVGLPGGGQVAIMGPDDQLLPQGESGEVVVDSSLDFDGYENDPVANGQCFTGKWFRTGDEGFFDEDGYLTLTGRIKDIINRGGEKITPSEVDKALTAHPDIAAAVAFPVPHATLGEEVAAAVVPAKGAALTDETLTHFLRGKLAPFKVPRHFVIVDKIPKGATGKIARKDLARALGLVTESAAARPARADDRLATPLEAQLQGLWADVLGLRRVGLHEDFFMLGGDSLQAVDLFLRVEKEIGRRLPRSVLFEAGTVAKMAERIEHVVPSPCIVSIQPKGQRPPFFCVHDGNGQVLNYRELARLIGDEQPFYGIQCRGLDAEEEPFTRIDDMAEYYIREIRKVKPAGPYYIGGYSFGGRVAYVMAQKLRAGGEEVAFLALLDVYSQSGQRRRGLGSWLAHHRDRIRALPPSQVPTYLWMRGRNLGEMIYMRLRLRSYSSAWNYFKSRGRPMPRLLRHPVLANDLIRRDYRASPYDGDATLFKAELYAWAHSDQHDGWHDLIKGKLEVRPISGRHFEIVKPPHVQALARELADALEKAQVATAQPAAKAS
jgi:acyl-CoA synthetase (AMP-forming)/AMP-acid ligase II/thioesterase domain-containing protein/acyl carrier protein